jgi:HemY protein
VQRGDWAKAIESVEADAAARLIEKPVANRWRALLKTALAQERSEKDARGALALAKDALDLAPGLVPAAVIAARMAAATGDVRRASRMLEQAWRESPHPDLAYAYLNLRPGDSAADRLTRARTLQRAAPNDPESALTLARAALEAKDFETARAAITSLSHADGGLGRPTARACLLMWEIEEAAGDETAARAWLARAARAPRDRAWVAEGIISDRWAPASPDGRLDAFVWRTPDERFAEEAPLPPPPEPAAVPSPPPPATIEAKTARPAPRRAATPMGLTNAPDDPGPARLGE